MKLNAKREATVQPTMTKRVTATFTDGSERRWQSGDSHSTDFVKTTVDRFAKVNGLTVVEFTIDPITEEHA